MKKLIQYKIKFLSKIKGKKTKQVFSLYSTTILGMILGVGVSIINTKLLGPKFYGDFKFLMHLFTFFVLFLTVGIFFSGSRLLAMEENEGSVKGIKGAMILYAALYININDYWFFYFFFFSG